MRPIGIFVSASLALLTACGNESSDQQMVPGQEVADRLDDAADQSAPRAEQVLHDAADQARQVDTMEPVDQPGSYAQRAMEKAGEAEASASPQSAPER